MTEKFAGKSGRGLFGDVMMEVDWSVGEILAAPRKNKNDLAEKHPEIVVRLERLAEQARQELGDTATKRKGTEVRQPGRL